MAYRLLIGDIFDTRAAKTFEARSATLEDGLREAGLDPDHCRVFLGVTEIDRKWWRAIRPKNGTEFRVIITPAGGDALRSVLAIGVSIGAALGAPYLLGALAATGAIAASTATSTVAVNVTTALLGGVAMLALTSLVPPPDIGLSTGRKRSSSWHARPPRQELRPLAPEPVVLGRIRVTPPYAAEPIVIPEGDRSTAVVAVVWSSGKVALEDIRLGTAPLASLTSVSHVFHQAASAPPNLQFINADVATVQVGAALQIGSPVTATTVAATSRATVIIAFPRGLFRVSSRTGDLLDGQASVLIEYRGQSASAWTTAINTQIQARAREEYARGFEIPFPAPGVYNVRVTLTALRAETATVTFTALQCWQRVTRPLVPAGTAISEFRIGGAEDVAGMADSISAIVTSILPDWDQPTQAWVERPTANPASVALALLRGLGHDTPVEDAAIDFEAFAAWHNFCESKGFAVGHVVDYETSLADVLAIVAACGRARVIPVRGRWAPIIDQPRTAPAQLFTARNVRSFQWHRRLAREVDGFSATFLSEPDGWAQREIIVYRPGVDPAQATRFDRIELIGVTDPAAAVRHARWRAAELEYRRDIFEIEADVDAILCAPGDLVLIAHDLLPAGEHAARISEVTLGDGQITSVRLDSPAALPAGPRYRLRIRRAGSVIEAPLANVSGLTATLTLATPLPATAAQVGDLAVISRLDSDLVRAIVRDIVPIDTDVVRLICVEDDDRLYQADSADLPPWEPRAAPSLRSPQVIEILAEEPSNSRLVRARVRIAPTTRAFEIRWRQGDAPWRYATGNSFATSVHLGVVDAALPVEIATRFLDEPWAPSATLEIRWASALDVRIAAIWLDGDELRWRAVPENLVAGYDVRIAENDEPFEVARRAHPALILEPRWLVTGVPRNRAVRLDVAAHTFDGRVSPPASVLLRPLERSTSRVILDHLSHAAAGWPGSRLGGAFSTDGPAFAGHTGAAFRDPDGPAFAPHVEGAATYVFTYDIPAYARDDDVLLIEAVGSLDRLFVWYRRYADRLAANRPWSTGFLFDTGYGWDATLDEAYWLPWPRELAVGGAPNTIQLRVDVEGSLEDVLVTLFGRERFAHQRLRTSETGVAAMDMPADIRKIASVTATPAESGVVVSVERADAPPSVTIRTHNANGQPVAADVETLLYYT